MSQPFAFRLERVRTVRTRQEDLAREALAGAERARQAGLGTLQGLQDRLRGAQVAAVTPDAAPLDGRALVARQAWLQGLEARVEDARGELRRHDTSVASRRTELTDAGRRRQALDRLHDRQAAEHRLEAGRREAAELDEMALLRRRPA